MPLTVTETDLRARLTALIEDVSARGWSVQQRGEYNCICRELDKAAAERAH